MHAGAARQVVLNGKDIDGGMQHLQVAAAGLGVNMLAHAFETVDAHGQDDDKDDQDDHHLEQGETAQNWSRRRFHSSQ